MCASWPHRIFARQRSGLAGRTTILLAAATAGLLIGCASAGQPACVDATLSEEARVTLSKAAEQLDFVPQLPCAFDPAFTTTQVLTDLIPMPGSPPQRRVTFVVNRHREQAYVLSETRAEMRFWAIPQGTHRLTAAAGALTADGFAGPSGSGSEIAYLRWRRDGVTFELSATLRPWLTERDIQALATGLMGAPGGDPPRTRYAGQ